MVVRRCAAVFHKVRAQPARCQCLSWRGRTLVRIGHRRQERPDRGLHRRRRRTRCAAHGRLQWAGAGRGGLLPAHNLEWLALEHGQGLSEARPWTRQPAGRDRRTGDACCVDRQTCRRRALPPRRSRQAGTLPRRGHPECRCHPDATVTAALRHRPGCIAERARGEGRARSARCR